MQAGTSHDDSFALEKHVKIMQLELGKQNPNEDLIKDRMNRTKVYRVQEVKDELSVKDLQARYSALQWGSWVSTYF